MLKYPTAKGWLNPAERHLLYLLARELLPRKAPRILNVGVEYGASIVCLQEGCPTATIVAVDINNGKYEGPDYPLVKFITADSGPLALEWSEEPFDLILIDGGHERHHIKADLIWAKHLYTSGRIAFHDCYDPNNRPAPHPICPEVDEELSWWYEVNLSKFVEILGTDSIRVFQKLI